MEDWKSELGRVSFYNEAHSKFSESFKTQFSQQLEAAFNSLTGIEDFAEKRGFIVLVGMEDMRLMYKDGFGFGLLELVTPHNYSVRQSFFWECEEVENAFLRNDFNGTNIRFGFCSDFQTDHFRSFKKRKQVRTIRKQKLPFTYFEELELFPDLTISIEFDSELSENDAVSLRNELYKSLIDSYVGEATIENHSVRILIDFQSTDPATGKKQLRDFIVQLTEMNTTGKVVSVSVE